MRQFKKYTGQTITNYINHLRVQEAINQLKVEDDKIITVAYSVGFESLSTFYRVFKDVTGKSPTDYKDSVNS